MSVGRRRSKSSRDATPSAKRRIDDHVHLLKQQVGAFALSLRDSNLDEVIQREYPPTLISSVGVDISTPLSRSFGDVGEKRLH